MYKLVKTSKNGYKGLKVVEVDAYQSSKIYAGLECTDLKGNGCFIHHSEIVCDIEAYEDEKIIIDNFYKNANTISLVNKDGETVIVVDDKRIASFYFRKDAIKFLTDVIND